MPAREFEGTVLENIWLTPSVVGIRFEASRKIRFEPGQFLSVVVPNPSGGKPLRRAYSFGGPPRLVGKHGYQLCIKVYEYGVGSNYMAGLRPGEKFRAFAPYGDLLYEPKEGRNACFISTGTGIAPFRAMILSNLYAEEAPERAFCIFGARSEEEIIYPGLFESSGVETVNCLSRPAGKADFRGRVTDYLKALPMDWPWHSTEFYICGNGEMIADVRRILREGHGVNPTSIHQEVYFSGESLIAA